MSDEEKNPQGNEPPAEAHHDHEHTEVVDDARSRALAEALQSSFKVIRVFMVVLAVAFLGSGITKVDSGEQALQLRFGQFKTVLTPGLHFAWPYPIDEIVQIPVNDSRKVPEDPKKHTGWNATDGQTPAESSSTFSFSPDYDGYTLTGDGNAVHVMATMNFILEESEEAIRSYEFKFNNITNFLHSALDNAVYHASASRSALDAYINQASLREDISNRIKKVVNDEHDLPIVLTSLELDVTVPVAVKPDYDAYIVVEAESQTKIRDARADATAIIANAEGQAKVILGSGKTTADRLLFSVQAEAKAFSDQRPFYESNPELFQQRLVTETMQRVLTNAVDVFYLSGRQPRIWLNRTPAKKKLTEGEAP